MDTDRLTDEAAYLADLAWDEVREGLRPEPTRTPIPRGEQCRESIANAIMILKGAEENVPHDTYWDLRRLLGVALVQADHQRALVIRLEARLRAVPDRERAP